MPDIPTHLTNRTTERKIVIWLLEKDLKDGQRERKQVWDQLSLTTDHKDLKLWLFEASKERKIHVAAAEIHCKMDPYDVK